MLDTYTTDENGYFLTKYYPCGDDYTIREITPSEGYLLDPTGIVQKVENGIVYTVEGNSGDSVRINQYSVGHYEILGYGVPQY